MEEDGVRLIFSQRYTTTISVRIKHIQEQLATLPIAYLKSVVLTSHLTTPKSPSKTQTLTPATTILTATILQLLPPLHTLSRQLLTWSVRTSLLSILPTFLTWLKHAESDLSSATTQLDQILEQHEEEGWKERLETEVGTAGSLADSMLDALDGREDVLPESYLERLEGVEEGVGRWTVEMGTRRMQREVRERQDEERRRKLEAQMQKEREASASIPAPPISTQQAADMSIPPSPPASPATSEFGLLMSHSQLLQKANLETANAQNHLQQIQALDGTLAQILQNANSQDLPELTPSTPPRSDSGLTPTIDQAIERPMAEDKDLPESNQSSTWSLPLQMALGLAAWGGDGTPCGTPGIERQLERSAVGRSMGSPPIRISSPDSDSGSRRGRGRRSGRNSPGPGVGLGIMGGMSPASPTLSRASDEDIGDSTLLQLETGDAEGELLFPVDAEGGELEDAEDLVPGGSGIPGLRAVPVKGASGGFGSHWGGPPAVPLASRPHIGSRGQEKPVETSKPKGNEPSGYSSHWNTSTTSSPAAEPETSSTSSDPSFPDDPLAALPELAPKFASHWDIPPPEEQQEAMEEAEEDLADLMVQEVEVLSTIVEESSVLSSSGPRADTTFKSHWGTEDTSARTEATNATTTTNVEERNDSAEDGLVEGFKKHWAGVGRPTQEQEAVLVEDTEKPAVSTTADSSGFSSHWDNTAPTTTTASSARPVPETSQSRPSVNSKDTTSTPTTAPADQSEQRPSRPAPIASDSQSSLNSKGFKSHWDSSSAASTPAEEEPAQPTRTTQMVVGRERPKQPEPITSTSTFQSHWELADAGVIASPLAAHLAPERPQPPQVHPPSISSTQVQDETTQTSPPAMQEEGTQTNQDRTGAAARVLERIGEIRGMAEQLAHPGVAKQGASTSEVEQPRQQQQAANTPFRSHWDKDNTSSETKRSTDLVVGMQRPKEQEQKKDETQPESSLPSTGLTSHWETPSVSTKSQEVPVTRQGERGAGMTATASDSVTAATAAAAAGGFKSHWDGSAPSWGPAVTESESTATKEAEQVTEKAFEPKQEGQTQASTGQFASHWDNLVDSTVKMTIEDKPTPVASAPRAAEVSINEAQEKDVQSSTGQFASHWDSAGVSTSTSTAGGHVEAKAELISSTSSGKPLEQPKAESTPAQKAPTGQFASHWESSALSASTSRTEIARPNAVAASSAPTGRPVEESRNESAPTQQSSTGQFASHWDAADDSSSKAPVGEKFVASAGQVSDVKEEDGFKEVVATTAPQANTSAQFESHWAGAFAHPADEKKTEPAELNGDSTESEDKKEETKQEESQPAQTNTNQAPAATNAAKRSSVIDLEHILPKLETLLGGSTGDPSPVEPAVRDELEPLSGVDEQGIRSIESSHFLKPAHVLDGSSTRGSSLLPSPIAQGTPIERAQTPEPETQAKAEEKTVKPDLMEGNVEAEEIVEKESMQVETPTVPIATDAHVAELDKILEARERRNREQEATRREMERRDAERLQKRLQDQERRRIENETELEKRLRERHEKLHGKKKNGIELGPVEPEPEPMKLRLDLNRSRSVKESVNRAEVAIGRSKSQREPERSGFLAEVKLKSTKPKDEEVVTPVEKKDALRLDVRAAKEMYELKASPVEVKESPVSKALPVESKDKETEVSPLVSKLLSPLDAAPKLQLDTKPDLSPGTSIVPSPIDTSSPHLSVPSALPSPQLSLPSPDMSFSRDDVSDSSSHILRKQHSDSLLAISFRDDTIEEGFESRDFYADSSDNGIASPFPQISVMESSMDLGDSSLNFDSSPDRSFGELLEPLDEGSPAVSDTGSVIVRRPKQETPIREAPMRDEKWNHTFPRMLDSIKEVLTPRKEVAAFSLDVEREPPPKLDFKRSALKIEMPVAKEREVKPVTTPLEKAFGQRTLARSRSYDERLGQRKEPVVKGALTREEMKKKREEERERAKVLSDRLHRGEKPAAISTPTTPSLKEGPWPDLQPQKLVVERKRPKLGARSATEQPPSPDRSKRPPPPAKSASAPRVPSANLGKGDALDRKIDSIVKNLPTTVRLTASSLRKLDAANNTPAPSSSSSNPRSGPGVYIPPPRAPSVAGSTVSTAPTVKQRSFGKPVSSEIKLYHLHRPDGLPPIKLFVRMVGEKGERVMVRVGGGWADLEEYLIEYASHHGTQRRVMSEGQPGVVEISDVKAGTTTQRVVSKMRSTASFRSTASTQESRPVTPTAVKTRSRATSRVSLGSRPSTPTMGPPQTPRSTIPRPSSQAGTRRPGSAQGTPGYLRSPSRTQSPNRTPSGTMRTPRSSSRSSRPGSRLSFAETFEASNQLVHITGEQILSTPRATPGGYSSMSLGRIRSPRSPMTFGASDSEGRRSVASTPLGLAGPKGKRTADDIGEEGRRWVEGMMGRVRRASGALTPMNGSIRGGERSISGGVLTYGVSSEEEGDVSGALPVEELGTVGGTRRVYIRGGGDVRRE
ncbi:hypothetical protein BJ508DRAFT_419682 [Ascobolus immersus RN42]|uniref:GAR domain-containing protein n=1 Tax=Ascobolus immersus RN42 TaxID=1160509 RepID=A0A3N4HCB0_ASCIM|nr:hypothetical protein BJ508DRAFT_419682 [Ascobolus immersus RN42]